MSIDMRKYLFLFIFIISLLLYSVVSSFALDVYYPGREHVLEKIRIMQAQERIAPEQWLLEDSQELNALIEYDYRGGKDFDSFHYDANGVSILDWFRLSDSRKELFSVEYYPEDLEVDGGLAYQVELAERRRR